LYKNMWITCPEERSDAKIRLFCFPFAGGGAQVFFSWAENISNEIELFLIKLPGRENRFNETPYRRISELIYDLTPAILPLINKPFMFFGHSLGAHISFYLIRHLRASNLPCPMHMFVSGSRAPHLPEPADALRYNMDDTEFIEKLNKLGGMTDEILKNKELLDLILPIIKADIEMLNTMKYTEEEPLKCNITSIAGNDDQRVSREDAAAWNKHTCKKFELKMIVGKHLFINTHHEQVINIINQEVINA
jgi:medium-chain acyl-[acyl-carrier-protein] hydrolase